MKVCKQWIRIFLFLPLTLLVCCAAPGGGGTVNELHFPAAEVEALRLAYDEETVTVRPAEGAEIVLRETMTAAGRGYGARVERQGGQIRVQEGRKPWSGSFSRAVELYLPADYAGELAITTTDGDIDLTGIELRAGTLYLESTAGRVRTASVTAGQITARTTRGALELGSLCAPQIELETTSGTVRCTRLEGQVDCTSTSGAVRIDALAGEGRFENSNSGALELACIRLDGNLTLYNKNGDIRLILPPEPDVPLYAASQNGAVRTPPPSGTGGAGAAADSAGGQAGGSPAPAVRAETKNGSITVERVP